MLDSGNDLNFLLFFEKGFIASEFNSGTVYVSQSGSNFSESVMNLTSTLGVAWGNGQFYVGGALPNDARVLQTLSDPGINAANLNAFPPWNFELKVVYAVFV